MLCYIPKCVAHAEQNFGLGVGLDVGDKALVIIEVEASRTALANKGVDHVDKRRTLALEVVG